MTLQTIDDVIDRRQHKADANLDALRIMRDLATQGYSAQMIAKALADRNHFLTRNSVIGRCRRAGIVLTGRHCVAKTAPAPSTPRAKLPKAVYIPPRPVVVEEDDVVEGEATGKTLMDLKFGECRYPLWKEYPGVERAFYCGEKTGDGGADTYCGPCKKIMYSPVPPRRRI